MNPSKKPVPSRTPEGIVDALVAHFNTLDVEIMVSLFGPDAISISAAGEPLRGQNAIR